MTPIETSSLTFLTPNSKNSNLWIKRLNDAIEEKLNDSSISNEWLAKKMEISERQLIRKTKEHSGLSPRPYLRSYRLIKAMHALKKGQYLTVKETAHAVGFEKPGYFIRQFKTMYGKKPLEVLRENGWR